MTLAYQGSPAEALPVSGTLEERRRQLFTTYVDQLFKRRPAGVRYTRGQTVHWLGWLANALSEQAQTVFYLERMQPEWLPTPAMRRWYTMVDRLGSGLVGGLASGLAVGRAFGGYGCFSHGALRLVLWRLGALPLSTIRFLDYATERVFLRRVGGGYIFVHRLLQDYFASLDPGASPISAGTSGGSTDHRRRRQASLSAAAYTRTGTCPEPPPVRSPRLVLTASSGQPTGPLWHHPAVVVLAEGHLIGSEHSPHARQLGPDAAGGAAPRARPRARRPGPSAALFPMTPSPRPRQSFERHRRRQPGEAAQHRRLDVGRVTLDAAGEGLDGILRVGRGLASHREHHGLPAAAGLSWQRLQRRGGEPTRAASPRRAWSPVVLVASDKLLVTLGRASPGTARGAVGASCVKPFDTRDAGARADS
jgi:hypothetical protein